MRYLYLIYLDEKVAQARAAEQKERAVAAHTPYIDRLKANGRYVGSERLLGSGTAKVLRSAGGQPVVTDGPFAESREQLGGFYLVEAKDLDEALADAAQCPALQTVAVAIEVRPVRAGGAAVAEAGAGGRYLIGIYETAAQAENEEARRAAMVQWAPYLERLRAAGKLVTGDPLSPASSATTLRLRDGKVVLTDGPFAESREQLGGYCVVRAADRDEAVRIAAECPGASDHAIEVRPVA
jgi:hypothetical protein